MRIGSVPYMNAKPLIHGLDREPGVELIYDVPSKLAAMLESGELAAAMVSCAACFVNPKLEIVPGICISCLGPAESVKLFHSPPREEIRTVALDASSLTSVRLAKIILREQYGLTPEFVDMPPPVSDMLELCDAAVVIGDPAMTAPEQIWRELDLGLEWWSLTGLPFVFAVWAVNPGIASPEIVEVLRRAKARGLAAISEISESESRRLDLPVEVCRRYLGQTMGYDLTYRHMESMRLFRRKSRLCGDDVGDHELRLYPAEVSRVPMSTVERILKKAIEGIGISEDECLELLHAGDLARLGLVADVICRRFHPSPYRTYVVDRNINYTNVCVSKCRFCAFFRDADAPDAYVLTEKQIHAKIAEAVDLGATQILMQGGLHPSLDIAWHEAILRGIKERFRVHMHSLSAPEIVHIARISGLSLEETIIRLKAAGLHSIPGGGAEILVDRVRSSVSPGKCTASEWLEVMEIAHRLSMPTTATMMFGHNESLADRVEHLSRIRQLQNRTGGFTAFIPWTFQPTNTELGGRALGGHEYLRMLAVSRIFLDNIRNVQASWVTQGDKIGQVALFFGANDLGSTMIEENVVAAAGVTFRMTEDEIRNAIEEAGFIPRRRDTYYGLLE